MATINRRVSAHIEGEFVVFLIGMRINKPWKPHKWLPVFTAMPRMLRELEANPASGYLGSYNAFASPLMPMLVQYWRSFEDLEAFARSTDAAHWPAWQRFNRTIASSGDVGIWHETYKVSAGNYECIYNNMPPFGLGALSELSDATGERETASGRMARPG